MQGDAGCVINVGVQTMLGSGAAYKAWNATFATYLTDELYPQLGCIFRLVPLTNQTAVYYAVSNSTIDLLYTSAGMHVCLEVSSCHNTAQACIFCSLQLLEVAFLSIYKVHLSFSNALVTMHMSPGLLRCSAACCLCTSDAMLTHVHESTKAHVVRVSLCL